MLKAKFRNWILVHVIDEIELRFSQGVTAVQLAKKNIPFTSTATHLSPTTAVLTEDEVVNNVLATRNGNKEENEH